VDANHQRAVSDAATLATAIGVRSTPTFIAKGHVLLGAPASSSTLRDLVVDSRRR
jgi:protein-disulfide isomerase